MQVTQPKSNSRFLCDRPRKPQARVQTAPRPLHLRLYACHPLPPHGSGDDVLHVVMGLRPRGLVVRRPPRPRSPPPGGAGGCCPGRPSY
jgi:hypothetical protein